VNPPPIPTWLLRRFVWNDALIGDLAEEFKRGRSGRWYRRQVLLAIVAGAMKEIGAHRLLAVQAAVMGWGMLLLVFGVFGDLVAYALAKHLWNWTIEIGYQSWTWWPFWVSGAFVSYSGFALSAWVVARLHTGPMLLIFAVSVFAVLLASAATLAWLGPGPVGVPHTLFYIVSVTLPYQWRSGFVFVPLIMLLVGVLSAPKLREKRVQA
jgi:hypothetical protein